MGDANTMDEQQMRRELIASATADPATFVDKVRENFTALTERISQADARILELTATAEDQAALITELSLKKDQAKREADQILSSARQEAAEIISDAKSQAKQITDQAETKLLNANVEADSIKTTKLNAIRGDISTLESKRLTERDRTLGFLNKVGQEYEGIIEQCSQTLAQLRTTRTYILDQANEVESTNFEHFDINQYLPHRTYQSIDQIAPVPPMPSAGMSETSQPMSSNPLHGATQPMPTTPVEEVTQQAPVVQQAPTMQPQPMAYDDEDVSTEKSFNEMFQRGGQIVDEEYEPVDEFGDSGLLMEAMAGMDDESDDFDSLAPSDSGLLFDALNSIDEVDEQRDMEEFAQMDDFDEFEDDLPPEPPSRQRIKVPQRRRGNRSNNRGWSH